MSERDPLLKPGPPPSEPAEAGYISPLNKESGESTARLVLTESWIIAKNALPVIASYVLQNSIQTGSVFIVGRIGPLELSVAAFSC